MKCQKCKKADANVKITQIINSSKIEMYLCEDCANDINMPSIKFDIDSFFSGFFNSWPKLVEEKSTNKACNICGYTFDDFVKYGQFGCSNCYETFSDKLDFVFEKMHGKTRHVGKGINSTKEKLDKNAKIKNKINQKEEMLKKCIEQENYEEAVKYRDEIKKLKLDIKKEE